jgi:hypothetical protein
MYCYLQYIDTLSEQIFIVGILMLFNEVIHNNNC